MKNNENEEEILDEYEDHQYEFTVELADKIVDDEIIPYLQEFDYENPEEDYVPGVATFTLFSRVVEILLLDGFTPEQLKSIIDEFSSSNVSDFLH